ncbi:MAG: hypothetical protein IPQ15_03080 [Betaproteobacteria bacterium]|nr:hypothetical protein [Betaproteobacteria bacterium]
MPPDERQREFHGRRWLTVVLRCVHLVVVIWLGACLMGAPFADSVRAAHTWVFASGVAMFAVDLWHHPGHLRETAGAAMLVKLALVAAMAIVPQHALALFWAIVVGSALVSHAPASFRHARVVGR